MSTLQHPVRHLQVKLAAERGWFHPIERELIDTPAVWRKSIHELALLDQETAMTLYEFGGDPATVQAIAERRDDVHTHELFESGDRLLVYAQFEPNDRMSGFIQLQRDYEVIIKNPTEFTTDGGIRVTLIGRMDRLRETARMFETYLNVTVEQVGEYRPRDEPLFHSLTGRQRETLLTALELGYYESPREATQADIAAELDRTDGTVAEHLQKVESRVLHEIVPD